ncbi:MAG: ABC transporter substrate-binding protein [Deltaproteobacteria bacterium]|nr:ABC transporter substrate-binding protein [Deltaproteobacteria bacterium]
MTKPILTLSLWLLCSLFAASAGAQERVIVSHSVRGSLSIGPLLYGIQKGFYRDEGVDLVYVSIRADLGIKALVSGDVDFIYSAGTGIRAAVQGLPVKILSMDFARVFHSLMARPEITSAAALKGKKVAVSSFGATTDVSARVALQALGLDPNRDVTILALGGDTVRFAALQAGTVQAAMMSLPLNIQLKKKGYTELFYVGKILREPLTGLVASTDKIKNNPQQIRRVMRAFVRGLKAFKTERSGFVFFAQTKFALTKDVVEEAYDLMLDSLSSDGFVEESVIENSIQQAKKLLGVTKPVSAADIVDYSFLAEVVKREK